MFVSKKEGNSKEWDDELDLLLLWTEISRRMQSIILLSLALYSSSRSYQSPWALRSRYCCL
jgi:hypothetical protein